MLNFPQFTILSSLLSFIICFHSSSPNLSRKTHLTISLGLHFLMKFPTSHKAYYKVVQFALVNLSFVTGVLVKDLEGQRKKIFSSPTIAILTSMRWYLIVVSSSFFWLHWVFLAGHRLSLVDASRGHSSLKCVAFSLRWLVSCCKVADLGMRLRN